VATAAAVALLESKHIKEIEKWEMMAEKSYEFLEANVAKIQEAGGKSYFFSLLSSLFSFLLSLVSPNVILIYAEVRPERWVMHLKMWLHKQQVL
jgi:hypothetical protein